MNSQINCQWHSFEDLTLTQMEAMFALRQEVFIVEQDCPYLDIDGKDQHAYHLLAWSNDGSNKKSNSQSNKQLIGTLRVFESYAPYQNMASIGRICTHQSVRKDGLGRLLVSKAIEFIEENYPGKAIQIGAQTYLKKFYQGFGFKQVSDIFDDEGIDHVLMLRDGR